MWVRWFLRLLSILPLSVLHALGGGYLDSDSGLGGAPLAAIDTKQAQ